MPDGAGVDGVAVGVAVGVATGVAVGCACVAGCIVMRYARRPVRVCGPMKITPPCFHFGKSDFAVVISAAVTTLAACQPEGNAASSCATV